MGPTASRAIWRSWRVVAGLAARLRAASTLSLRLTLRLNLTVARRRVRPPHELLVPPGVRAAPAVTCFPPPNYPAMPSRNPPIAAHDLGVHQKRKHSRCRPAAAHRVALPVV